MYSSMKNFLFFTLLALAALESLAAESGELFFNLEIDGNKVGYQKSQWTLKNGSPSFSDEMVLQVVHGKSHELVRHEFSMWQKHGTEDYYFIKTTDAGTVQEVQEGRIENNRVQIKNKKGKYVNTSRILPFDVIFPPEQLSWYLNGKAVSNEVSGVNYFYPKKLSSVLVTMSVCNNEADSTLDGVCLLRSYKLGAIEEKERWYFDAQEKLQKIEASFGGLKMVKKPCSQNCIREVEKPWDFMGRLIVSSPYKISQKLANGKINYLISSKSGRSLSFLNSSEQSFHVFESKNIVSVCANCNDIPQLNPAPSQAYIAPNSWVQSNHPEIRRLALSAVSKRATVRTKMLALVKLTQKKMNGPIGYVGYSTALDALHSGSGDCSEFALLLTAFARAHEIPARVVFGMAYSSRFTGKKDVFSPHAWVQVWDQGRWVSYDAALNTFDATHIALAESDGSPEGVLDSFNQLSDIKIEKAAAITAEP